MDKGAEIRACEAKCGQFLINLLKLIVHSLIGSELKDGDGITEISKLASTTTGCSFVLILVLGSRAIRYYSEVL